MSEIPQNMCDGEIPLVPFQTLEHGLIGEIPMNIPFLMTFPGNLKYMHDGRICFLDFGLMDRVSPRVMEGFADGIRSVVSQNWTALAHSMQVVEFVPDPVKRSLERMEVVYDKCTI